MPAETANLDLYLPGGGSLGIGGEDEQLDIDRINQNMQKIDEWSVDVDAGIEDVVKLVARNQQFIGPAASIGGVADMKLGDTYQETDGDKRIFRYDGTNWVVNDGGLFLITATAVSGTNVTKAGGRVTAAASPEIVIDGVFTSRFRRYLIVIDLDSASVGTAINLQLRAASATLAGNYTTQLTYNSTDSALVTAKSGPNNEAQVGPGISTTRRAITLEVSAPATANPTLMHGTTVVLLGAQHLVGTLLVNHSASTVADGLRISPSSVSNLTGTVSVYGRP